MKDKKELQQLKLSQSEQSGLPLGFATISVKDISPEAVEQQVTVRSEKFNKADLFSLVVEKPISKF